MIAANGIIVKFYLEGKPKSHDKWLEILSVPETAQLVPFY